MKLFLRSFLMLFLFSIVNVSVKGQSASFTASITSGCSPIVVDFTNTTGCATCTYTWDLDNGTMPIHTTDCSGSYITPGTYTVTLTAVSSSGVTTTYTQTIVVYPSPTVTFTASETSICPGQTVTFTSTSTGGVSGALTYIWNFGDGTSSTLATPSKTYPTPGNYNVTLAVTNSEGCTTTLTVPAYIHVNTPPSAGFSAPVTTFCDPPATATFTSTSSGTGPFTYAWRFGDGGTGTGSPATHTYSSTGSYNVTLVVTDANGCEDSVTIPSYITVTTGTTAAFTYPDTVCVYSNVTFTNTSGPHIASYWTYGDGNTGTGDPGTNAYGHPGTYTVTLIIYNGSCYDTVRHNIVVLAGPATSFTFTPVEPCPPPSAMTFTGTAPAGTTVTWLYGDGGTGTGVSSAHTYADTGTYTVSMISTNPHTGCTDTITHTFTIYGLVGVISAVAASGCVPEAVTFGVSAYTTAPGPPPTPYPYAITGWSWTFGDGSASVGSTPTHTYTAEGTYNAVVTITTANGCTVTDTTQIKVGAPPVITFSVSPAHACYHDNSITFTAIIISGPVNGYFWEFGDGTTLSDTTSPVHHTYMVPGVFSETVIPYYNGCPGAPVVLTNNIRIDSPKAVGHDVVLCSPVNNVDFMDVSIGADSQLWLFGDGTTSTLINPTHAYPSDTTYTATLIVNNTASGCSDTAYLIVDLHRPVVNFTASDSAICKDGYAIFTPTVTGGTATSFSWYVNGIYEEDSSAIYSDTFYTTGRFTVMLIIADQNHCRDTFTRTNYELVAKPVVSFTEVPPTACWPLSATFTDHSTDVAGASLTSYIWLFGDGATTTITTGTAAHTFTVTGAVTTEEIVTDNIGCKDTGSLALTIYHPVASFTASNTHPCTHDSVLFTNTSTGIVSSYWKFGDGGTSTLNSPWHTYSVAGPYTVTLAVTDSHGCTDTTVSTSYINVSAPAASFYMSDSVSICPPITVHFINTSTGAVSYNWSLGDGSTSAAFGPSDLYIATGYYTVTLIATNSFGCTSEAIGHVDIFGYSGAFSYNADSGCVPLTIHFNALISNVPNIIWDFADGSTSAVSFSDSIVHTYLNPGAYVPKLILSDNSGCKSSSVGADTIKVDAVTPGFTTIPNPVCLGGSFSLSDTSKSYWSVITEQNWTFDGTVSTIPSPTFTINVVGTYPASLTVTDAWGCTANVSENVMVYAPPVITVTPDTTICVGDAATLTGFGGVSYTWSPTATLSCTMCNPTFASPIVITQYTVTGTDEHGCSNTDTTSVFLKTLTVSVARGDTQICDGIITPLYDSGGTKYTWIPGTGLNNPYIADPLASPNVTTTYMAIAQLSSCIPDTNYVTIIVHPLPTVDAGPDQTLVAGSVAQLSATGTLIYKYAWDNTSSLSCDSCPNPVASMTVTTTYTIQVSTTFGCTNSDSVTIHLFCDQSQLFIPNSFTPNGDGQNDVFYPRGTGVSIIKSFRIYNRWGEMLFERSGIQINDASNAWDGTYNGGSPRPDVYVYIIDAICDTGEPMNLKGDVTIIR